MSFRADLPCRCRMDQLGMASTKGVTAKPLGAVAAQMGVGLRSAPSEPDQAALNTWSVSIGAGNAAAVKASRIIRLPSKTTCQ